ncbi:FtsQ-type POTRA domain-containing protein [Deltaproteobacteria bacterium]|nr:FtsQ-type POTRA domain-containing protein [Deltaproteobacteria bacterium]
MKRKSILNRQSVKRRTPNNISWLWKSVRLITSLSLKVFLLFIGMISLSLLFLYLYQYLITSPYIKLEEVIVKGVGEETKYELIDMAELNRDMSLLALNLNKIKEKMESHPWVRSVDLEKRFPHTLIIEAEREMPAALVVSDRLSYMNRWGTIFKEVERGDDKNYPLVTGISKTGGVSDEQLKIAAFVLDLFKSETGEWSHKELSEIHVSEEGDVSLYSISMSAVIRLGSKELQIKKDELKKIAEHLRETGRINMVTAIDLNYEDGAVVSFKKTG